MRQERVPGKEDCEKLLTEEHSALCNRTWIDIKNYIHNRIKSNRKKLQKQNQNENY